MVGDDEARYCVFRCNACRKVGMHILSPGGSLERLREGRNHKVQLSCKYCNRSTLFTAAEIFMLTYSFQMAKNKVIKENTHDDPAFITYGRK